MDLDLAPPCLLPATLQASGPSAGSMPLAFEVTIIIHLSTYLSTFFDTGRHCSSKEF